jgi:excisionase family DNA binding protein
MIPNLLRPYYPLPNGHQAESPFEDRMISIKEAAERCSVQEMFIRKAISRGELKVKILGPKAHRIWLSDLKKWADSKEQKIEPIRRKPK